MSAYGRVSACSGPARLNSNQLLQLALQSAVAGVWIHTTVELLLAVA